jgi:nucleotide-binding universal stress UspA family protein
MFNKILVAIDSSENSLHVFEKALSLAKTSGASLMLFHVLSPFEDAYINPVPLNSSSIYPTFNTEFADYYLGLWEELKQEKIKLLTSLCNQAKESDVKAKFAISLGHTGRMICEKARDDNADLIIIGRRGISGLSELFLGSVSNYVLHYAPCSVLTVQKVIEVTKEISQEEKVTSVK